MSKIKKKIIENIYILFLTSKNINLPIFRMFPDVSFWSLLKKKKTEKYAEYSMRPRCIKILLKPNRFVVMVSDNLFNIAYDFFCNNF